MATWIVSCLITFFYLIMIATAYRKTSLINKQWMLTIGALTYPLYLIHQNIGFMFFSVFGGSVNKYVLLL
ncbi:MAG: hypothetical protein Q9M14_07100, partial [Mariprofundaceae bacterium]|nr:hypothetical protein [Mariprofundaceae bacterium]